MEILPRGLWDYRIALLKDLYKDQELTTVGVVPGVIFI